MDSEVIVSQDSFKVSFQNSSEISSYSRFLKIVNNQTRSKGRKFGVYFAILSIHSTLGILFAIFKIFNNIILVKFIPL